MYATDSAGTCRYPATESLSPLPVFRATEYIVSILPSITLPNEPILSLIEATLSLDRTVSLPFVMPDITPLPIRSVSFLVRDSIFSISGRFCISSAVLTGLSALSLITASPLLSGRGIFSNIAGLSESASGLSSALYSIPALLFSLSSLCSVYMASLPVSSALSLAFSKSSSVITGSGTESSSITIGSLGSAGSV